MVYGGRPSKGCASCRARKIRCDQKPNGCENCDAIAKLCPGYRNEVDVRFRDQTSTVLRKFRDSRPSSDLDATGLPFRVEISCSNKFTPLLPAPGISSSLSPSLYERALSFFLTHHVMNGSTAAHFYLLPSPEDVPKQALINSSIAIGLVELSSTGHSEYGMIQARENYMRAVKHIKASLNTPTFIMNDLILISIYTLTTYEMIACNSTQSLNAWSAHVRGAAAMLEVRGTNQFQTPDGIRLFMQVVSSMMVECLRKGLKLPGRLPDLAEHLNGMSDTKDVFWRLFFAQLSWVDLRADAKQTATRDVAEIYRRSQYLDDQLVNIERCAVCKTRWRYRSSNETSPGLASNCLIFNTYLAAEFWNFLWTTRLQINHLLTTLAPSAHSDRFSDLNEGITIQSERSKANMRYLIEMILSSVPQYLNDPYNTQKASTRFLWDNFVSVVWNCAGPQSVPANLPLLRLLGGYGLLWSLRYIGLLAVIGSHTRKRVESILRNMANKVAIRQAGIFADQVAEYGRKLGESTCSG